jgi:hypothetical protein
MPNYSFRCDHINTVITVSMPMSNLQEWLRDNPTWYQTFEKMAIVRGVDRKPDEGFTDLLKDIKARNSRGMHASTVNTIR